MLDTYPKYPPIKYINASPMVISIARTNNKLICFCGYALKTLLNLLKNI